MAKHREIWQRVIRLGIWLAMRQKWLHHCCFFALHMPRAPKSSQKYSAHQCLRMIECTTVALRDHIGSNTQVCNVPSDLRTCQCQALLQGCPFLAAARRHWAAFSGHLSLGHPDFPRNHAAFSTRASKISVVRGRGSLQMLRAPVFLGGMGCGTMENTSNWRHGIYEFWNGWTCESLLVGKCPHQWSLNLSRPDQASLAIPTGATPASPLFLGVDGRAARLCPYGRTN